MSRGVSLFPGAAGHLCRPVGDRDETLIVRQIFDFSGSLVIKNGIVKRLTLNGTYPLIHRFGLAFQVLLDPYGVCVCIGKT